MKQALYDPSQRWIEIGGSDYVHFEDCLLDDADAPGIVTLMIRGYYDAKVD
jgi:hypothetical protein